MSSLFSDNFYAVNFDRALELSDNNDSKIDWAKFHEKMTDLMAERMDIFNRENEQLKKELADIKASKNGGWYGGMRD